MAIFICKNISKRYKVGKKELVALNNVSVTFPNKGLVGLVGKSGSGKSTLLNLLMGIEKPTSGTIKYLGFEVNKFDDKDFSDYHLNDVSLVYQHYNLFDDLTVFENLLVPLNMKGINKDEANSQINNYLDKFGLGYLKDKCAGKLSGGEKQRVAIIRSLITNPKVILCDEPTGALDKENSILVMETLKNISKDILVIIVSHNLSLIKSYADRIVTLKDGEIVGDTEPSLEFDRVFEQTNYKYSSRFTRMFSKSILKKNLGKTIFSVISCAIGFAAIFLAAGFSVGSKESQEKAIMNNLSIQYSTVSETTFYRIENSPLSFQKTVRPNVNLIDEKITGFNSLTIKPNFSYFFSQYPLGLYEGTTFQNFQVIPLLDLEVDDFSECIVNKEFLKNLGIDEGSAINKSFTISNRTKISYQTDDLEQPFVSDDVYYSYEMNIKEVVEEFSFLNTPKMYVSYELLEEKMKMISLENISFQQGRNVSVYDYVINSADDNPSSSYSYSLYVTDKSEILKFFDLIKDLSERKDVIQVDSMAFQIHESYVSFISSFSSALIIFVVIVFTGIYFALGMISFSTFIQNKKNSAVLTCLGARNSSIIKIFLEQNIGVFFVSLLLSIGLSLIGQIILNPIIKAKFSLSNLISIPFLSFMNTPLGLIILLFVIGFIVTIIFTIVPIMFYRKTSISDELRDE